MSGSARAAVGIGLRRPPALRLAQLTHAVETLWRPAAEGRPIAGAPASEARSLVVVRERGLP